MPVNVRRFCTLVLLTVGAFGTFANAQTQPPPPQTTPAAQPQTVQIKAPSAAEIMRERISKAKAFIAVRNYNAAIYELENIRRETSDSSVQAVTTVLLMNSYLEQGDYKRAQDFLTEAYNIQKTTKPGAADIYNAVAGQVVKGARMKVERYKALGLTIGDRNLPLEAVNDVERMRETLELVIAQAKENGKDAAKAATAMGLLEEATTSRSALARDDYDAKRWKDEVADSREELINARSVITNAVDGTTSPNAVPQTVAANTGTAGQTPLQQPQQMTSIPKPVEPTPASMQPTAEIVKKTSDSQVAANNKPAVSDPAASAATTTNGSQPKSEPVKRDEPPKIQVVQGVSRQTADTAAPSNAQPVPPTTGGPGSVVETAKESGPMDVGSLISYATKQTAPVYPAAAKSMRSTGVVRVEVTVDESGEVAEVQKTTGPPMLQTAARDAVKKWRFKPFIRDGQPVRAIGFVNFNFSL